MKNHVLLVMSLFLTVMPGFCQDFGPKVNVSVPFEFAVSNTVLPAGDYTLTVQQPNVWRVTNVQTGDSAFLTSHDTVLGPYSAAPSSKLVFAFDGNRRIPSRVIVEGDNHVHETLR